MATHLSLSGRVALLLTRRYISTTSLLFQTKGEPEIPLVPKNRDPNAVLKALASTVSPLEQSFVMGRTPADPLAPLNRKQMVEYMMAREAGKMAAQNVIKENPKIFKAYTPFPNLLDGVKRDGTSELEFLIQSRKTDRAYKLYKRLKKSGKKLSLETENKLLALLAYENARKKVKSAPVKEEKEEEEEELKSEYFDSASPEEVLPEESQEATWSHDNLATEIFNEMKEKDGCTYGAMIQGLVKYRENNQALELFKEAKDNGHQLSLSTFNDVLKGCVHVKPQDTKTNPWEEAKSVLYQMTAGPLVVHPDTTTFNILLEMLVNERDGRMDAMMVIREMIHLQLSPNLLTFYHLLKVFGKIDNGTVLYEIVDYIENNPQILEIQSKKDFFFLTAAMSSARALRSADLAVRLRALAKKDDQLFLLNSIEYFFNNYIAAIATSSDVDLLKKEYDSIVPSVCIPRTWTYTLLFKHCEMYDAPHIALHYWNSMKKNKISPDRFLLHRLVGALSGTIDPSHSHEYFTAMKEVLAEKEKLDEPPNCFVISMILKFSVLTGQLEKAWEYYGLFDKYGIKPSYISLTLLLQSHIERADTEQVLKVLDLFIDIGYGLSETYVNDICCNLNLPSTEKSRIMKEFRFLKKNLK